MSSACSSVLMHARSAACMGCRGSMASGMPTCRAYSRVAARPSSTCVRANPMSRESRFALQRSWQRPRDHHQTRRAESFGLVDGPAIVVQRGTQARGIRCREEAAAAVAGQNHARILELPRDGGEPCCLHLVAPRIDGADAAPGAGFDDGGQRELLSHRRRVDREMLYALRKIAHQAIPCTARTALMRLRARSGSRSRPARSANRNSSARCATERALCWPPTMTKWSCRPLR